MRSHRRFIRFSTLSQQKKNEKRKKKIKNIENLSFALETLFMPLAQELREVIQTMNDKRSQSELSDFIELDIIVF